MKIATSLNIRPPYLSEAALIERIAASGYDSLDFNFCDLTERLDWNDEVQANQYADGLAQAASDASLSWAQAHGPMFNVFGDAPKDQKGRDLCPITLRLCGRMGVPWMVLHPETVPNGAFDDAHHKEQIKRNVDFFQSLLPHCEKYGVGIAIENLPEPMGARGATRCFGGVPGELIELIDALHHPLIGACWDTGHAKINRLDQKAGLAALGPRLKVLHIQENDGKGDDHMLPFTCGTQGVDWNAVADGLRAAKYQGAFTYEAHNGFRALPEPLFDDALRFSAKIARFLAFRVAANDV